MSEMDREELLRRARAIMDRGPEFNPLDVHADAQCIVTDMGLEVVWDSPHALYVEFGDPQTGAPKLTKEYASYSVDLRTNEFETDAEAGRYAVTHVAARVHKNRELGILG